MWKTVIGFLAFASACVSGVYAGGEQAQAKSKALAHYIMAVAHDLNSRPVDAIVEYERSIALNNSEPLPHLRLAGYYVRTGLLDKAVTQLKTVLNLDPQNSQAHYLLALVYSTQKKYDLAAAQYEQILQSASKHEPDNLEIYIYLAQLYYSQNKYAQAIAQFKHILSIQPDNVSANFILGGAYLAMNQRALAKDAFKKVLTVEPGHDGALNALAYMYAEEGVNLDLALEMARTAVTIDPVNGAYLDTLGWVLFKKGMITQALMSLQQAESIVQDPVVYEHLGDVYNHLRQFAEACKAWRTSLDLDPQQISLKAKLGLLEKTITKVKNLSGLTPTELK